MTHTEQPADATTADVAGYRVRVDRAYQPHTHMWVQRVAGGRVRIGLDPLGVEINGTLAQLSLAAPGERVAAGRPFGQLEAAKFVGPLLSPVGGVVAAANADVLAAPGLVEDDPYGVGWLVELVPDDPADGPDLVSGADAVVSWFARRVDEYRIKGVLAE
jgi:glycine cleavage system H protein